ncbi:MAG: Rieske 2Fe-2S domain-containing protein, partial [Candidatus Sulfotelmatobacter sp.]
MDAILPSMSRPARRENWRQLIDEDFDTGNRYVAACGVASLVVDTLRLFGPNVEKGNRVPDKTAVEDVQGESQSRQQALVATTDQSASRPNATQYVGTPAVGTSKAAAAAGVHSVGPPNTVTDRRRRRFVWSCVAAFLAAWFIAFFRFFLPRVLFEPATVFKIGYPAEYALGIDEKYLQKYRIWVDRTPDRLFVIYARCTHLGCTPDWKPAENKFKCPCHGSGYDSEGINFEGPAPRPMDRAQVEVAPDGQIVVD